MKKLSKDEDISDFEMQKLTEMKKYGFHLSPKGNKKIEL